MLILKQQKNCFPHNKNEDNKNIKYLKTNSFLKCEQNISEISEQDVTTFITVTICNYYIITQ